MKVDPTAGATTLYVCGAGGWVGLNNSGSGGGYSYAGHSWYAGSDGQSCTDVCSTHGGYNAATKDVAGSSGTDEACDALAQHFKAYYYYEFTGSVSGDVGGLGCLVADITDGSTAGSMGVRDTDSTTAGSSLSIPEEDLPPGTTYTYRRICACNL